MKITTDEQFKLERAKLDGLSPEVAYFITYLWRHARQDGEPLLTVDELIKENHLENGLPPL